VYLYTLHIEFIYLYLRLNATAVCKYIISKYTDDDNDDGDYDDGDYDDDDDDSSDNIAKRLV